MNMMNGYLTWWIGGIALGVFTIVFRMLTSRTLGVSGSWKKMIFWREESRQEKAANAIVANKDDAASALMAETLAEFGEDVLPAGQTSRSVETKQTSSVENNNVPWTAHVVFLLSMTLGGFLWAVLTGHFSIQFQLSPIHTQWTGGGLTTGFLLLMGGFMVGLGTQMAGGCSSGHGLSGCSNLSPTSFAATASYLLTAMVVSVIIKVMIL